MTATVRIHTQVIVIDLDDDAAPFDLPALGHFGGTGRFAEGSVTEIDPDWIKPYAFTPRTVVVRITDGVTVDQAAFTDAGFWHPIDDACQDRRNVHAAGVHRVHWPAWLCDTVDAVLAALPDPRPAVGA